MKERALLILSVLGLVASGLAGLSEHVSWLHGLCSWLSDGCRDAAQFTLMRLPIWTWGMAFYGMLLVAVWRVPVLVHWVVPMGLGMEGALLWIMIAKKILCVLCLGNLLVVILIVAFYLEMSRFWQVMALGLLFFFLGFWILPYENEMSAGAVKQKAEAAKTAALPESPSEPAAARVGDTVIMDKELESGPSASKLRDLQLEIYRIKRQRLDQLVMEAILQKEAQKRGKSIDDFVNGEVLANKPPVTEQEIDQYLKENEARIPDWKGTMEELRGRVRTYLQQQKNFDLVVQYAQSVAPMNGVEILLKEPESVDSKISRDGSPSLGPADASVVVYEFSDYQCPACRQVHEAVHQVRELYKGQIRWVYKNYPLKMHKDAAKAAEAALCANDQNKFWEYQDKLFAQKDDLPTEKLLQFASELGLAPDPFRQCLDSGKHKAKVEQDIEDAGKVGVDRTPSFLINGKISSGSLTVERFKALIDEELKRARETGRF